MTAEERKKLEYAYELKRRGKITPQIESWVKDLKAREVGQMSANIGQEEKPSIKEHIMGKGNVIEQIKDLPRVYKNFIKSAPYAAAEGVMPGYRDFAATGANYLANKIQGKPTTWQETQQATKKQFGDIKKKAGIGYTATEIGAGLLPAVLSGGSSVIGKALLSPVGTLAQGAAAGAGYSDPGLKNRLKGAVTGAALSGALGVGLSKFPAIGKKALSLVGGINKKALSLAGGVSEKNINRYIKRRPQVNTAPNDFVEVSDEVLKKADEMESKLSKLSGESYGELEKQQINIPKSKILDKIQQQIDELQARGVYGEAKKADIKALQNLKKDIKLDITAIDKPKFKQVITQSPEEFNPKKMEIQKTIDDIKQARGERDLKTEMKILDDVVKNSRARELAKYAKKGKLPEVLGEGTGFKKMGDQVSDELGYPDSETARLDFELYMDSVNRVKEIRKLLSTEKWQLSNLQEELNQLMGKKINISDRPIELESQQILPDTIPLQRIKDIVQSVDEIIAQGKISKYGQSKQGEIAKWNVRRDIDSIIKEYPEYAKIMKQLEADTRVNTSLKEQFRTPGGLAAILKDISRGKRTDKTRALQHFEKYTGQDYTERLKDMAAKEDFTKDITRGSQGVNLMANVTAGVAKEGNVSYRALRAIGASLGLIRDKYGTAITKKMLDVILDNPVKMKILGKFVAPLKNASSRGYSNLALTHYLLYKNNPEYRKSFDEVTQ